LSSVDVRFLTTPVIVSCQWCGMTMAGSSLNSYVHKESDAILCNVCADIPKNSEKDVHTIEV
jgi:hypothetical protein